MSIRIIMYMFGQFFFIESCFGLPLESPRSGELPKAYFMESYGNMNWIEIKKMSTFKRSGNIKEKVDLCLYFA